MPDIRHAIEAEEMMAYLDGELSAARAAEAMTHLERCADCQTLAADLRRVSQEMAAWQVEAPREMTAPVEVAERPKWKLPTWRVGVPVLALAGAIAALYIAPTSHPQNEVVMLRSAMTSPQQGQQGSQGINGTRLRAEFERAPLPSSSGREPTFASVATLPVDQASPLTAAAPMIERTATLNLDTRDFDQLRGRIDAILARRHGYLAELTLNTPGPSARSLSASLRIPAAELDAALTDLRQLGRVESESQKGEDVTRQYADLVARLGNARNTEQRLTQLLAQRTGKLSDVLEVEREIDRVRGQIEQMDAERRTTTNLVSFATVQLNAGEDYKAQLHISPDSTVTRLRNAAVEGYKNLTEGVIGAALFLIAYGPAVLLWGTLVFFLGCWLLRRRRSRQ